MHNTYFSSIYAVRCKESFSLSFNGYSNFWYERFDRTPSHCSSCCGCCDCCALSTYRVPIKPGLVNGLRQSTLLQLSASRRLILGGGDQYFSRLPAYGLQRGCYVLNCSVKERTVCNRSRRRIKGRCFSAASQKGREIYDSFGSDDAEAILSLLSEEADEDAIGIKWKNVSSSKRMEAEKKSKNVSRERNLSSSKKVEIEKKGNLKQHETFTIDLRREDDQPNKEREAFTKSNNSRKRRDVSSCSSYYSFSSSGDFGSDLEVQDKHGVEELSVGYEKDEANHREGQVKEEFNRQRDGSEKLRDVSNQERTAFGSDIDWNLRKKSEKKLAEVNMEETGSTKEHQDMHSRAFRTHESNYGKASILHKQFSSDEDNSSFVKDLDKKTKKSYIQTGNIRKHQSTDIQESGGDEVETTLKSQKTYSGREGNLEISETLLQKTSDEHKKFVGSASTAGKEVINKNSQKYIGNSKFQDTERTSNTRMKNLGAKKVSVLSSVQGAEEQQLQKGEKIITQAQQRRKSQQFSEVSQVQDSNVEDTSTVKSRTRITNWEENSNLSSDAKGTQTDKRRTQSIQPRKGSELVSTLSEGYANDEKQVSSSQRKSQQFSELSQVHESNVEDTPIIKSRTRISNWEENSNLSSDAKGTWPGTDKRTTQSIQPRKGSEHVITLSEGYASDEKQVSSSQRTSDKVRFIQKSKLTSVVKTRESSCQTDERIAQFELDSEAQRPRNLSISHETASRDESSFQGSLNLASEAGKHVILAEGDERRSAIMLIPSSSQLVGRGSAHVELTAGIASPEICLETSESGSSALYDNSGRSPALLSEPYSRHGSDQAYSEPSNIMAPEDALGSADRLEKSSKQFVDEFVEKVRHEVITSETQEMEVTGTKLAFDDEGNRTYSSRQHGTQNGSQLNEHGSSRSSGFPGTKGPSDEMWDVTEPSVKQSPIAEEPEISKESGKPIVNRTGRSLWSMIADVVRLRWGSRAGSSTSVGRSGERNSSNKSDSETWFSGQEHEETSKSNVIKEITSLQPQAMTSDKLKPGKHYTRTEGEVSDTIKLKDKRKHLEVGSSSPNTLESGSTSVGASYASGEENASWTEDGKDLKVTTSGIENLELPIPSPARRPPIVGEIVNIGRSNMPGTESVLPMEEPVVPVQAEFSGSGSNDGELKQRKFQRNRQVLRDRFDDWEEAYKLELEQRRMDEMFMMEALLEAKKAADTWEVPVGAVLVQHGKIISRGFNLVEELRDSTAHAEMICIREASNLIRTWRLSDTTLYVTLEPCPMCAGAILQARIDTVVWGAPNKLLGADGSWIRLFPDGGENVSEPRDMPPAPVHPFHPKIKIRRGVLATECADVMQQFFQLRRKKKKEEPPKDPSSLPVTHHPSKFLNKMHDIFHMMFCL